MKIATIEGRRTIHDVELAERRDPDDLGPAAGILYGIGFSVVLVFIALSIYAVVCR